MFSNYSQIPVNSVPSYNRSQSSSSFPTFSSSSSSNPYMNSSSNRFVGGGFLGPFVLGGITGGLLAPAFYPRFSSASHRSAPHPLHFHRVCGCPHSS